MVVNFWLISREVITFKTNLICISSVLKYLYLGKI